MRIPMAISSMMVLLITITAALTGYGQVVVRKPVLQPNPSPTPIQKVAIFKDSGKPAKSRVEPEKLGTGTPPAPLSAAEKNAILRGAFDLATLPGNFVVLPFAMLTPRTPFIHDRASLSFSQPHYVDTTLSNEAGFRSGTFGAATVAVYPQKQGQWFMVDCSVETTNSPQTFTLASSGGQMQMSVKGSGHIQALIVTQSFKWYTLQITALDSFFWTLYGCEVNSAN